MPGYRLLRHHDYAATAEPLPDTVRRKALWAQVLLGTRGRTPSVKSTTGYNARWRRTPVQGFHYYLWWIPLSESELAPPAPADSAGDGDGQTILIHGIRHHDETDTPIELRSLAEFDEVTLSSLDPRFGEQRAVGEALALGDVRLATIKGLPGSGKTISLFYLVRDLLSVAGLRSVLYVTYTTRLKRAARDFLAAQDPAFAERVKIRTLTELETEITGLPTHVDPFGELREFTRFLEQQNPASLGTWRRYPATLYTEIRGHILGRTFPTNYALPEGRLDEAVFTADRFDLTTYAASRGLDVADAEPAWRLGERLRGDRFFLDQIAALRALEQLRQGRLPRWLGELDALIVDEVQDLTLLQIALLGDLARGRSRLRPNDPFAVVVAGDESQIVQPSGFDWGVTKDLLRAVLGRNPVEFEYRHQRRSPANLARLIDNAWSFYGHLPKALRPSANRQSFVDDAGVDLAHARPLEGGADENGRILIVPSPELALSDTAGARALWQELVETLGELPGRVVVDLTETLLPQLTAPGAAEGQIDTQAGELIFLAREIKGLERATVVVHGLDGAYQRALRMADGGGGSVARFEARRLFDEMRVALSRSTDKLVLLEPASAPVLRELEVGSLAGHFVLSWDALQEVLRTEEMSEIEVVETYLDEVDDLLERSRWEQARRRNRRAYDLARQLDDRALLREAEEQHIRSYLLEAAAELAQDRLQLAYRLNRQALDLADAHGDVALQDEVEEQFSELRAAIERRVAAIEQQASTVAAGGDYDLAYRIVHTATDLLTIMHDPALQARLDEASVAYGWEVGRRLVSAGGAAGPELSELFRQLAEAMQRQRDEMGAQLASVVAERYRTLPDHGALTAEEVRKLIRYIDHYLEIIAPLELEPEAFAFVRTWLEEAFSQLGDQVELYYSWAIMVQTLAASAGYPKFDDHLWDLENRAELTAGSDWKSTATDEGLLRFAAFVAAYNGEPAAASRAWEKLGQIELAASQARAAGELERAYHLLRQAGQPLPEELSIAVKFLRQAAQLTTKQRGLQPAERRALAEQLTALLAVLTAGEVEGEEGGAGVDDLTLDD